MATYKILGQNAPGTTNATVLYTVPSAKSAVVSTISITNVSDSGKTYRVHVVPSGGTAGVGNALVYESSVPAYSMVALTLGISLAAGDTIQVRTSFTNAITFQAFGSEV